MNRYEFEVEFTNPSNSHLRLAHLMLALRAGPSWETWAQDGNWWLPSYFNDILFLQCYVFFKLKPTRRKLLTMFGFVTKRGQTDKGFLIDPAHRNSQPRQDIVALVQSAGIDFGATHELDEGGNLKVHKARHLINTQELNYTGDTKTETFRNRMRAVVSEMWLPGGGSMQRYLTQVVGGLSHADIQQQSGANLNTALQDESKKAWLTNMIRKFEGRSMSYQLGTPFDVVQLGLTSPFFRNRVEGSYQ
jgi:hypothetical protein